MSVELDAIQSPQDIKAASIHELNALAEEIRSFLLTSNSETGGHIGANLGVIELTIALHFCFDSPRDTFLFDTGHQGYTHKLLTGRKSLFGSLNTYKGMNRFVTPRESEHDPIEASHAGSAISVGLGLALANKLSGNACHAVALVGDSALAEGLALEGLNHALVENVKLLIVINDNGYAISPGFGAIHNALQSEGKAKKLFESLGANYLGPVDGHDIAAVIDQVETAKNMQGVSVLHAKTIKGKGWQPADTHPFRMHFSFPFDIGTGQSTISPPANKAYPDLVAEVLLDHMEKQANTVCITPSTLYATGLAPIFEKFPERCFDPGMEEQHALSMCVGFALKGFLPIIAYQSTFLQRAFDQLIHDIAFANKPCLILSYRSGFSGYDNPTHHGIYDISYMRAIPNLSVYYPKDGNEAQAMTREVLSSISGPTVIMMPYGPAELMPPAASDSSVLLPEKIGEGRDVAIISVGNKVKNVLEASASLEDSGVRARVINIRQLHPLNIEALVPMLQDCAAIVCVEEAVASGGLSDAIASLILKALSSGENQMPKFSSISLPCAFIEGGSNEELERAYGLDVASIVSTIKNIVLS